MPGFLVYRESNRQDVQLSGEGSEECPLDSARSSMATPLAKTSEALWSYPRRVWVFCAWVTSVPKTMTKKNTSDKIRRVMVELLWRNSIQLGTVLCNSTAVAGACPPNTRATDPVGNEMSSSPLSYKLLKIGA